ncbi:antitoxin component YwqK of YwqJK toxin-antitoxin module [Flavobacterium sp. CG_23.5]|uniref:toxin-antitoxin system YwqK family antitoxin n=1 Tax=unclassified Flavobacterium TaxID=196869 RepID=UPI0018C9F4F8|nr:MULTISPECIES: membrane-binding protein [unclassified Flavobacterium]MBG6110842.1 antitoxin component YwqK of YwqJK toxin-antitoxin module [Flavobacterium sp. CG_9.10]MBP2283816.1 antitoxin component YwqK of YwqJK toxin-antitoxin module [Flavobacterium sp. CG_23.5]
MKNYVILVAILFTGILFAQESKPVLEPFGKKVKATYFYENGQMQQEGFFENGKLEGFWVSYNEDGSKKSSGFYDKGIKTGKWFFWNDNNLSEVDYSKSQIASVKTWKRESIANVD